MVATHSFLSTGQMRGKLGHNLPPKKLVFRRPPVTYAIAFDLDTKILEDLYPNSSWQNAYLDIEKFLKTYGFERQQGSVYYGNETVDAVTSQNAVIELTVKYSWFAPAIKDIRMLRIEDNNDLRSAIDLALRLQTSKH